MSEQAKKVKHKNIPEWAQGLYYNSGLMSEVLVYHDEEAIYFEHKGKDSSIVRFTFEDYLVCRPVGVLAVAHGSAHLCPGGPDTHPAWAPQSRDHLSVISAIIMEGKLLMMEQERSFKSQDVVRFLRHLLGQNPGKLLLIWDGSPIHRSRAVKDFLASGAFSRMKMEQLSGYAPDLNPEEGIWKHLK
jgi:DDE superfamily endonuclease